MKVFYEAEMVDLKKIKPNKYNPNKMDDQKFRYLVEDIKANGFIGQPIIVNQDYEIIDGYHRWMASKAVGAVDVPVVVFAPKDKEHQKILTIALNSKRGEMDSDKLAFLISELNQKYSISELELLLGYAPDFLQDKLDQTKITDEFMEKIKQESLKKEKSMLKTMIFAVREEQEEIILSALEKIKGKSKGQKLTSMAKKYLKG